MIRGQGTHLMARRKLAYLLATVVILIQGGCRRDQAQPAPSSASSKEETSGSVDRKLLRIAAASDLQRVLPRLARRFEEQSGVTTTLTLDASGRLAEQIKAGAPFDVFLSANVKFVTDLANAGLIKTESVKPYARGRLALCVHRSVSELVQSLEGLLRPEVKKIAIANPEYAPYGVAAKQALEQAGLWSRVEPKIVRADSVRQALTYAQNGDAEAALASHSLAEGADISVLDVDPALYDPLVQALGVVSTSAHSESADDFARFMLGDDGRAILQKAGFDLPSSPAAMESRAFEARSVKSGR
jgi:molybdate transport system substrate-binding protein